MKRLSYSQINVIRKIKNSFNSNIVSDLDYSRLGFFYLCPFSLTKGNARLVYFFNKLKSIKSYIKVSLIDLYNITRISEFKKLGPKLEVNYKTIIVNWGSLKDFNKDGSFKDKYLNINSSKFKNVLWYIIYLDKDLPKKIGNNIVIIYNSKKFLNFSHLKKIIKDIFFKKKKIKFLNQEISYLSLLASFVNIDFDNYICDNLKKILMPYEGQPFQNVIFLKAHQIKKEIETIGYIHSFPIGLPTNLFKRPGHPKKLYVNSISKKYALNNFFGWSEKNLKVLPSARFKKSQNSFMKNKIFLPIYFESSKRILESLSYLINYTKSSLLNLDIKNHPRCLKSKKHIDLIFKIKKLVRKNSKHNSVLSNFSIFIGPTGSVIEALERNVKTFHICENPIIEGYTKKIWKYINCFQISDNLFEYKKIENQKLLKFSNDSKIFKKYIF